MRAASEFFSGEDVQSELELSELPASDATKECITPTTVVDDVETVFTYDGDKIYEPNNYHEQYNGQVTVRYALEHSLNVPTDQDRGSDRLRQGCRSCQAHRD